MIRNKYERIVSSLITGGLLLLGLFLWLNASPPIVRADPGDLFVTTTGSGTDCTQAAPCTLQTALGQAVGGDAIYLATGTYTGTGGAVVTVTQSIAIYGGWDGAATTPPARDPIAHPTTLDGEGTRRVVYIPNSGPITPTLEGLRLTNGSTGGDGGGIYAEFAHITISDCQIYSNTANGDYGGGVHLYGSNNARLTSNAIFDNTINNGDGGGIHLYKSDNVMLASNSIYSNTAVDGNGGGAYVYASINSVFTNTMLLENQISGSGDGAGAYINSSTFTSHWLYTTIARNRGGNGQGVYVDTNSTMWLTNTILVSHTTGIQAEGTLMASYTLWGADAWANLTDTVGSGTIISSSNLYGDPAFVDASGNDYHIHLHSAAVDVGTDAGVDDDIDGDARPQRGDYDVGADEVGAVEFFVTPGGGSAVCLQNDPCTMDTALGLADDGDTVYVAGGYHLNNLGLADEKPGFF